MNRITMSLALLLCLVLGVTTATAAETALLSEANFWAVNGANPVL